LLKIHEPLLDRGLLYRLYWQRQRLSRLARTGGCDVLFVPGGSFSGDFRPFVTMSRNMLPFEWRELVRYRNSWKFLRLMLLRWGQAGTFRKADGLVFLTEYAYNEVMQVIRSIKGKSAIIPHGVDDVFLQRPRIQLKIDQYSYDNPFRVLYVSIVDLYKHQWQVAEATFQLRKAGFPIALDLIGPANPQALRRLQKTLHRIDPEGKFIRYRGAIPHRDLPTHYQRADLCVFASSCENMPNILLEGMAAGLPIACSNRGPMPEVLGDAGVYFDPENSHDIAAAIRTLIESSSLRTEKAAAAFERVQAYSWGRCASELFEFFAEVVRVVSRNTVSKANI